jgi:ketosteroid isomerase-like protein
MYRAIVARQIRTAWRRLDARDYRSVLDQFAPTFEYRFVGDHAMGGVRHTRVAMEAWFERIFRLFPEIRFELQDVLVGGPPWRTRAVALVRVHTGSYENEVAQTIHIRWGRIVRINTLEDTQKLAGVLAQLAADGMQEAAAPPIEDGAQTNAGVPVAASP